MKLLLAAFPPELGDLKVDPPPGWWVDTTGVGASTAAAATAFLLERKKPERVLFVGSCGAYDERLPIGTIFSPDFVLATSVEEERGESYRPSIEAVRWLCTWNLPFPHHPVVTPPAITRSEDGVRLLGRMAPAEHLELNGVFAACNVAGVPVAAALIVVNEVGPNAHEQWMKNHVVLGQRLIDVLRASGALEME